MQFGSEPKIWDKRRRLKKERLSRLKQNGKVIPTENIVAALEAVIEPGNKVVLEGNNQKQADFLARSLCELNPDKVHDLHMIIPSMSLPEHLDVFEKGIARKLDFSYSAHKASEHHSFLKTVHWKFGAVHTYIELYSRLYVVSSLTLFWLLLMQQTEKAISTPVRARKILRHCSKQQLSMTAS